MARESVFSKICNRTYTHGLPDWYNSKKWLAKIVWTLILLGAGAAIGWYSYQMISAFLQHQTVTQISEVRVVQMLFPNVTICFSARFNKTAVETGVRLPPAMAMPSGYDEKRIRGEFFRYLAVLTYQSLRFDEKIKPYLRSMYEYNFDRGSSPGADDVTKFLDTVAFRCTGIITLGAFSAKWFDMCNASRLVLTDYGVCYSVKVPNRDKSETGPAFQPSGGSNWGLLMKTTMGKEHMGKIKTDDDLALRIHLSGQPEPNDRNAVLLLPNHHGDVRLNPTRKVIDPTLMKCAGGSVMLTNREPYTKGLCEHECVRNYSVSVCFCTPAGYLALAPSDTVCTPDKMLDCVLPNIQAAKRDKQHAISRCSSDQCPVPCESWDYAPSITFSKVIAKNSTAYSYDRINPTPDRIVTDASVYFSQMHYMNIEQQPLMKLEEFICNLGGTWGLWTGVSVVAFVQFCYIALCGAWEPDDNDEEVDGVEGKKAKMAKMEEPEVYTVDKKYKSN